MGDFDINNDAWLDNATSYDGRDNAWITYSNGALAFTSVYWSVNTRTQTASVPEPPMLLLLGAGLIGLMGRKLSRYK